VGGEEEGGRWCRGEEREKPNTEGGVVEQQQQWAEKVGLSRLGQAGVGLVLGVWAGTNAAGLEASQWNVRQCVSQHRGGCGKGAARQRLIQGGVGWKLGGETGNQHPTWMGLLLKKNASLSARNGSRRQADRSNCFKPRRCTAH
jgi:hypothetical protein